MTLKERKGARGRTNAQAGVKMGLDYEAACQTVPHCSAARQGQFLGVVGIFEVLSLVSW